ncbi:MAG: hypothetical protein VXU42_01360 [Verrucomicrobiota bacterium]|nr:hypothetical protein [Verrucomicrobiota bacterium]
MATRGGAREGFEGFSPNRWNHNVCLGMVIMKWYSKVPAPQPVVDGGLVFLSEWYWGFGTRKLSHAKKSSGS